MRRQTADAAVHAPKSTAEASPPTQAPRPDGRRPFLDWLRIGAFALLVLYHVGMFYVSWDWHVKSPVAWPALEPLMRLSNPWRMSLLFLVSGAATWWLLHRRPQGLLKDRARRLLLPLVAGMVLVVPPQPYFEVVQKSGYAGSYLDFLALYFSAYGGFCRDGECLVLPTWNHLWFLPYLFLYTAVAIGVHRALGPRRRAALADRLAAWPAWAWWWWPVAWLALLRLTLFGPFGQTHALIDDPYNHLAYGSVFLLGMVMASRPEIFARLETLRWPALGVALACWAGIGAYFEHVAALATVPEDLRALQRVAHATLQWSALVALVGFAHRHLDRDHRWRAPLNEAVFPVYLLHQTLIILFAMLLARWALPPGLEAPLLVLLTVATALLAWRLLRHGGPLRPWFGLPAAAPQPPRRPAS